MNIKSATIFQIKYHFHIIRSTNIIYVGRSKQKIKHIRQTITAITKMLNIKMKIVDTALQCFKRIIIILCVETKTAFLHIRQICVFFFFFLISYPLSLHLALEAIDDYTNQSNSKSNIRFDIKKIYIWCWATHRNDEKPKPVIQNQLLFTADDFNGSAIHYK